MKFTKDEELSMLNRALKGNCTEEQKGELLFTAMCCRNYSVTEICKIVKSNSFLIEKRIFAWLETLDEKPSIIAKTLLAINNELPTFTCAFNIASQPLPKSTFLNLYSCKELMYEKANELANLLPYYREVHLNLAKPIIQLAAKKQLESKKIVLGSMIYEELNSEKELIQILQRYNINHFRLQDLVMQWLATLSDNEREKNASRLAKLNNLHCFRLANCLAVTKLSKKDFRKIRPEFSIKEHDYAQELCETIQYFHDLKQEAQEQEAQQSNHEGFVVKHKRRYRFS